MHVLSQSLLLFLSLTFFLSVSLFFSFSLSQSHSLFLSLFLSLYHTHTHTHTHSHTFIQKYRDTRALTPFFLSFYDKNIHTNVHVSIQTASPCSHLNVRWGQFFFAKSWPNLIKLLGAYLVALLVFLRHLNKRLKRAKFPSELVMRSVFGPILYKF